MVSESTITSTVHSTHSRPFRCSPQFRRTACLGLVFAALATWPSFTTGTALDDYVAAPDPDYSFSLVRRLKHPGYTEYQLNMTSQKWREDWEVNRTLWRHELVILVPDTVSSSVALLEIHEGNIQGGWAVHERNKAVSTNTVVASLRQALNQPLVFTGDGRSRRGDEILAFTFARFMDTGDETWPALLPIVKSAVRAMDTVQTFLAEETGDAIPIEKFVVGGTYAWTPWLTAAVDSRIEAIIPRSSGFLNIDEWVQHVRSVYEGVTTNIVGGYPPGLRDFVDQNVLRRLPTAEGQALLEIVDPYAYRDRLTLPKFLILPTGSGPPDSAQFFFHDLVGPKYLRYFPNVGSSWEGVWEASYHAFYQSVIHGDHLPRFTWTVEPDGSIRVETETIPLAVRQWQATNPTHQDFRIDTFGERWSSSPLEDQGGGVYVGRVARPSSGYTAFFVEMEFPSGGPVPHTFTTEVVVASSTSQRRFVRGDCNSDGTVNVSDAICALDWLFAGRSEPGCLAALNINGDDKVDIADPLSLLNFLFGGGPSIADPFPDCRPGTLPADSVLGCANPPNCQ